jgi:hypothetical protein
MAKQEDITEETTSLPANDAWTGLLIVAFLSLSVGTGFLAWDYLQYSDQDPPKIVPKTMTPPVAPPPPAGFKKDAPKEEPKEQPKKDDPKDKKDDKVEQKKEVSLRQPTHYCREIPSEGDCLAWSAGAVPERRILRAEPFATLPVTPSPRTRSAGDPSL